jgi:signal transduction histidine kinase
MSVRECAADEIAMAAHDLNNLCASILGFAELAEALTSPGTKLALYIAEIAESGQKAAALAQRLRGMSLQLRTPADT